MPVGVGIAKLLTVLSLTFAGGSAIYNAVKPPPVTPQGRYSQSVSIHKENEKAGERQRRENLKRGLTAESRRRASSTSQQVNRPGALRRLIGKFRLPKLPKLRPPIRLR